MRRKLLRFSTALLVIAGLGVAWRAGKSAVNSLLIDEGSRTGEGLAARSWQVDTRRPRRLPDRAQYLVLDPEDVRHISGVVQNVSGSAIAAEVCASESIEKCCVPTRCTLSNALGELYALHGAV